MPSLLTINWNPDPELFNLFGIFPFATTAYCGVSASYFPAS